MSFKNSPVIEESIGNLDSPMYMTHYGQSFKYFHQHIHQRQLTGSGRLFHRYAELPAELQLRVMQHCSAPILFQLMHTDRNLRIEARKLFFSGSDTWYRLNADFLLQRPLATESLYEPCFLASIQQLEIYSPYLDLKVWSPEVDEKIFVSSEECSQFIEKHTKTNIQAFWCTVQRLCPQVKRIMFTKDRTFPDYNLTIDCFQRIAQLSPQGLGVFFYTTEPAEEVVGRRRKRILWQLRASDEIAMTDMTLSKAPGLIVVPPQKPHRGHVGDFIKSRTIWEKYCGQRFAAEYHRAAADNNNKQLVALDQRLKEAQDLFWDWWGDYPSEQRTIAEREVVHQLEHDILYAQDKPVSEHALLKFIYEVECSQSF
ncbi:hypothetical protein C7974DRAFT_422796 [Boeremia exigua]|uniref:uncharacterized protein n=1 Tax=Boeremia exigua TaxID=749465 RepID=UPI001E8EA224|nr:uncharacterized protein C7974DRAFT_422796 [Boeremia exigua]KAH6637827.1 hypothetical protein C7974DRAFT_422796 [Boeremia exigua]